MLIKKFREIKKSVKKEKESDKIKKKKDLIIKTFVLMIFILISTEAYLWFWSEGDNIEPYEWGSRLEIPYKVNDCYELFSNPKNRHKTRVLIIGDSRPESAFYPELFDEYFNDKTISYNLAIAGTAIPVQALLINKVIIPKLKPDIIIWEISVPQDFTDDELNLELDERTLNTPMGRYYNQNTKDLDFDELCEYFLFKSSRIYRYRSNLRPDFFYLNEYEKTKIESFKEWYQRGYLKHYDSIYPSDENISEVDCIYKLHKDSVEKYFDTLEILEEKTDFFLIVTGPNRFLKLNFPEISAIFNKLSPKNYLNLNGNETFYNDDFWHNPTHLNIIGASLYTKYLYEKISNNIKI
ncbi:MAG: hypothetical protein ACFFDH_21765 [Promethearchaeota archaeon]